MFDILRRYDLSTAALRKAVHDEPAVKAEVEAEIAALAGIHPDRCVVTADYVRALKEALA